MEEKRPFIDDELEEQQKEIREVVYKMGKPCAPLLLKFYCLFH